MLQLTRVQLQMYMYMYFSVRLKPVLSIYPALYPVTDYTMWDMSQGTVVGTISFLVHSKITLTVFIQCTCAVPIRQILYNVHVHELYYDTGGVMPLQRLCFSFGFIIKLNHTCVILYTNSLYTCTSYIQYLWHMYGCKPKLYKATLSTTCM